jgi:glycosyltransferase involved in cell wall biosynthesis
MIRVGFLVPSPGTAWFGGLNYYRNLFKAIASEQSGVAPIAFLSDDPDVKLPEDFPRLEVVRTALLRRWRPSWFTRLGLRQLTGNDYLIARTLASHKIDVLSHSGPLGEGIEIPAMSWIPDFQHLHLPHMFSGRERQRRDSSIARMVRQSSVMIVSSEAVRRDLCTFFEPYAHKVRVLKFADCSTQDVISEDFAVLAEKYTLPKRYFFLPNQFWAHKNHRIVVRALGQLRRAGVNVMVVATGNTRDSRNPDFFSELMKEVEREGVEENFRVLGIVPYSDLVGLMRGAIAVINPSHFEGWSTSVEEARALGKRALLSAIPVHLEQAPPRAIYFDPDDPASAATGITRLLDEHNDLEDQLCMEKAWRERGQRRSQFAREFRDIASDALSRS